MQNNPFGNAIDAYTLNLMHESKKKSHILVFKVTQTYFYIKQLSFVSV